MITISSEDYPVRYTPEMADKLGRDELVRCHDECSHCLLNLADVITEMIRDALPDYVPVGSIVVGEDELVIHLDVPKHRGRKSDDLGFYAAAVHDAEIQFGFSEKDNDEDFVCYMMRPRREYDISGTWSSPKSDALRNWTDEIFNRLLGEKTLNAGIADIIKYYRISRTVFENNITILWDALYRVEQAARQAAEKAKRTVERKRAAEKAQNKKKQQDKAVKNQTTDISTGVPAKKKSKKKKTIKPSVQTDE